MTTDEMFWKVLFGGVSLVLGVLGYMIRESYEGMTKALGTLKDAVSAGDKSIAELRVKIDHVERELVELKERLLALEREERRT